MKIFQLTNLKFPIISAMCFALMLVSCSKKPATAQRPAFSSDSAYAYIEKQMSFGPRVPNSAAHMQCAVWLIEQLRA